MSGPIDIVLCLHNAFRRDTLEIDDAAFKAARSGGDITHVTLYGNCRMERSQHPEAQKIIVQLAFGTILGLVDHETEPETCG